MERLNSLPKFREHVRLKAIAVHCKCNKRQKRILCLSAPKNDNFVKKFGYKKMAAQQPTKLNAVQMHLLKMFARPMNEQDLQAIKALLSNYYAQKVDEESERIWEEKGMSQQSIDELLNAHLRTPYK
jgi:hypothetical protein